MTDWQKFPISNFRTGFNEALEPWLLPRDGFPILRNAHLYRGVIEKIAGFNLYAKFSYRNTINLTGVINGINTTFTGTLSPIPSTNNFFAQAAINVGATAVERFAYDSDGIYPVVNLVSNLGGTGTVNLSTGAVSLIFNTPPAIVPGGYNAVIFSYDFLSTALEKDIMGIKPYYAANGTQDILIFSTRRVDKIITLVGFAALNALADYGTTELPHEVSVTAAVVVPVFGGGIMTYTGTLAHPIVPSGSNPGDVSMILYDNTGVTVTIITDNSAGLLTGVAGDSGAALTGTGFINYFTGAWTFTFSGVPAATDSLFTSNCIYGDYFTGDYTNFFSVANYQANIFITNNVDNIRYYDGICVKFLNTNVTTAFPYPFNTTYDISSCLHVAINRERLLLIGCVFKVQFQLNNIYWSVAGFPLDFTNNEKLPAPTTEAIRLYSFVNSDMVVRFANSERIFRYTGDAFSPFRWDSTNVLWRCDTNYSAINYDSWFSSVGRPAIVGSDGVNVQRADPNIPDFTLNDRAQLEGPVISISQNSIGQCYGERFDDFKEGWMCFKQSLPGDSASTVQRSDSVLAFNYDDKGYAVYDFPFNCLGFGTITSVDTWGDNFDLWGSADYTWGTFFEQHNALVDLAGDRNGNVYELGTFNTIVDIDGNVVPYYFDVISKNFNPFIDDGELCRFGYVDFFVSANAETKMRVQIYADDNLYVDGSGQLAGFYQETTLTFTPTDSMSANMQAKIWKRVYVGAVAREHTIRMYQNPLDFVDAPLNQPIRIHGIVLYMKPAGRLFN